MNILREHPCDALGISFSTALTSCPVCKELIGDAPPFPSSVGEYLDKVKAYRRVAVDYENNKLVAAEDGEFVLITNVGQANQPIILPRLTHFSSRRDFYHNYQDYYVCENPSAGEVLVIHPATVEKTEGGWKLKEVGRLEVLNDASARVSESYLTPGVQGEGSLQVEEEAKDEEAEAEIACVNCGTPGLLRNTFCWHCGKPLRLSEPAQQESSRIPTSAPPEIKNAPFRKADSTVLEPPVLASFSQGINLPSNSGNRRILYVLAAIIGFAALGFVLFLLPRLSSKPTPVEAINDQSPGPVAQDSANTSQDHATPPQTQTATIRPEDEELKRIQERRDGASTSEQHGALEELAAAEKKYPEDYRFPYEHAKLSITGTHAHHEAFSTLFLAGQKAIENNRSDEMLDQLVRDKDGAFNKLAKGHSEWTTLIGALKNKNSSTLKGASHH